MIIFVSNFFRHTGYYCKLLIVTRHKVIVGLVSFECNLFLELLVVLHVYLARPCL